MGNYKALFVGEKKVKNTNWKNREDAAGRIVTLGLSVLNVYERAKGAHYFDISDKIAKLILAEYGTQVPQNVAEFVKREKTK